MANRSVEPVASGKGASLAVNQRREVQTSLRVPDFDLEKTLNSGQVFHWQKVGAGYVGAIDETPAYLQQSRTTLRFERSQRARVIDYLALDHEMRRIEATFPRDSAMCAVLDFSRGIRIVRQPRWECLATFLASALKQVIQIRAISLSIRQRFGRTLRLGSHVLYSYPRPEVMAELDLEDLLACKLGFRAKNVLAAARMIAEREIDLDAISQLPTPAAREELRRIPGVGPKIANCVLLFAYGRLEVVPVDVWIERAVRTSYFPGTPGAFTSKMRLFSEEYFGPYGGYVQQYLFHYWRLTRGKPYD